MSDSEVAILMVCMLVMGVLLSTTVFKAKIAKGNLVQEAVLECEINLPRNQHCVPVYSAEVSDE